MIDKIFFNPGEIVQLKKDVENKPRRMLVHRVDMMKLKESKKGQLLGITCIWFTEYGRIQQFRFDSKDLKHVEL